MKVRVSNYMWNYAGYQIDIGVKGGVGAFQGKGYNHYSPVRLSGVVGTDGTGMTGTGFLLEYPKQFVSYVIPCIACAILTTVSCRAPDPWDIKRCFMTIRACDLQTAPSCLR